MTEMTTRQAELVARILEGNGDETMRESAARCGIAVSTLWKVMNKAGYRGRSVTKWERPQISVDSRESVKRLAS